MSAETFQPTRLQRVLFLDLHPEAQGMKEFPADSVWYGLREYRSELQQVANIARAGLGKPQGSPHAKAQLMLAMGRADDVMQFIRRTPCLNIFFSNALHDDTLYTTNLEQLAEVANGL